MSNPIDKKTELKIYKPPFSDYNPPQTSQEWAEYLIDLNGNYDWSHIPDGPVSENDLFED